MCSMEDTMISKKHRCSPATKPLITMNQGSRTISKIKPKIRIIHIFAPEIIKTDVANFRGLVQSLTGKPITQKKTRKETNKRLRFSPKVSEKIKEEDKIWDGANSSGGFLGGFGDLDNDGFMHEFSHHNHGFAPVLPNLDTSATLVDSHLGFTFGARSPNLPTYQ
ncbi:VQ motif-containing protein 25-like [Bidens hawaiensis]|uniref:VQ motif-containing protein 25-like n=1 Tax=Bidens hawaiensis TaxID=980011 RepID=UPI00404B662C